MPDQQPPQYRLSVDVDGERVSSVPLEDPFVVSTVTLPASDLRAAVEEGRDVTVVVRVDGTRAALAHVFRPMDLTPNEDQPATIEGAEGATPQE